MNEPAALAHEAIHQTVENLLANRTRGVLLDVPTGEGALAKRLISIGYDVKCADLYPAIFRLDGAIAEQADLDSRLPYADDSFDFVVCVEGLEHVENPANAIREFSRILKSGATLIVSVPNIMNVEERLRWLFSGYTSHFKPLSKQALAAISEEFGEMPEIALHINPIGYSEVRYLLEKSGFALKRVVPDARKKNIWAFRPITGLIRLFSKLSHESKRRARWADELNSDEVLLGGNTLIFEAERLERK
ncbi:MAG: class I SAM-dependent methyltransferase [Acidobacteria bacterium]|nr:class I SAM-dependent methyltransferase [Acidobacteriota bacterium]